jgi:two-component system OmpR family sensor kinase
VNDRTPDITLGNHTASQATKARWTLRRRLVFATVGLLAAVSAVIGVVSVFALQSSLMDRLDTQLIAATSRTQGVVDGPNRQTNTNTDANSNANTDGDDDRPRPSDFLRLAGLPPGTVGAIVRGGTVEGAVLDASLRSVALDATAGQLLLTVPADGLPHTIDFAGQVGEYRIAYNSTGRGDGLIVGMPLRDVHSTVEQLSLVIALVTLAGLAAALLAGRSIVRLALRPLERVAATAAHVSELSLDRGEVALAVRVSDEDADPRTEVGQVGAALNRMLGHIAAALEAREKSERKVRAFVADASHELRTPLASIRGYSELTRRGGHDLPPDVVHALARVESESIRMTELVEDLLLLARLDEGRSLESKPVDITGLLANSVSDAHAAGPDHEWSLQLPNEAVIVVGDERRLQQVVANLLTNARVHTPEGSHIVAALSVEKATAQVPATATITISDDGPGIDPAVRDSVFERFSRGDNSRSRAAGSTGLGLAIVAAIVEAHHGGVDVRSRPGATVFTVSLPVV